ncbi:MAG: PrsW family intramembrane metalloprotease [Bacteroidales bacterium]|nr:PrsW family intramembrane metalloprotease [Bacteroidales bacterium]
MSIILIASLAPVLLLLIYIYAKDKYQKEPFSMLMKALLGGVLAAGLDILLLTIVGLFYSPAFSNELHSALYQAFCMAALPEELCKLFFLYLFIWNSQYFDEYYDGVEYAAFVGLGFAGLENVMYVLQGGVSVAVGRALFAVPAHFFFAIFMGYFFSMAKFKPWKKSTYLLLAYIVPVILHGIYDGILMTQNVIAEADPATAGFLGLGFFIFFLMIWRRAIKRVKHVVGK